MSVRCPDCGAMAGYGQELGHRTNCPSRIVGHKTFATDERDAHGFPVMRHEPLRQAEADKLWEQADKAQQDRALRMPDVQSAIRTLTDAHTRLTELGWREAIYCPKDGSFFEVIEAGSTGIHRCAYRGEWPDGSWDIYEDGDVCPSHPILFRLYPEDQAKEDARRKEAAERYADSTHEWGNYVSLMTNGSAPLESCGACGIVRRADKKNKPCRGPVSVGPRLSTGGAGK